MNKIIMDDTTGRDRTVPALTIRNLDFWYGSNHALKAYRWISPRVRSRA